MLQKKIPMFSMSTTFTFFITFFLLKGMELRTVHRKKFNMPMNLDPCHMIIQKNV